MSTKLPTLSIPQGGGAIGGIGEKFSADLFTGTGNFSVPVAVPSGRNGTQPALSLGYSTGNGNSPFGLGWNLSVPGVMRKTSKGIPLYNDEEDIFILSGAEDLVAIKQEDVLTDGRKTGLRRYFAPRTEGLFARITHVKDLVLGDYWEVRTKDGMISYYGTPRLTSGTYLWGEGGDPCTIAKPDYRSHIFAWKLFKTIDPFGNHIVYTYNRDLVTTGSHIYDQLYLSQIKYGDYGDPASPDYMFRVDFNYTVRPDPFSSCNSGFEIRTRQRCSSIDIYTNAASLIRTKTYFLNYLDTVEKDPENLPMNRASVLDNVQVTGYDGSTAESMPSLQFRYSDFEPKKRKLLRVQGKQLPTTSLARPDMDMVDLDGNGLPDILQMNVEFVRYWRNLGNGVFDAPKYMTEAPAGLSLGDPGVQMLDMNGDARADLFVNKTGLAGFFPTTFQGSWDKKSFQPLPSVPTFSLSDPEVRLMDLDGDGITDVLRNGARFECFFNDQKKGFYKTTLVEKETSDAFPDVSFADHRVRMADMTGDGLQDIIFLRDGRIEYWMNMGYGHFGKKIVMKNCPRFPVDYNPARILVGDIDGDGMSDIIYVDNGQVTLWINQSGNAWSDPVVIKGMPQIADMSALRLIDLMGSGVSGVLYSNDAGMINEGQMYFLDFTGGNKPYLLQEMDNNMGSITRVAYKSSVEYYLADQKLPSTRWRTQLPFPVLVVSQVEAIDAVSNGKLTTQYFYHHGYWDGVEREFRGFGRVDQRDTETFEEFNSIGIGLPADFIAVSELHFSPPTESRNWFNQGPVGTEFSAWYLPDYSDEYWSGDPAYLSTQYSDPNLTKYNHHDLHDAYRALRGSSLRSELYALDGTALQNRPYTVSENLTGVTEKYAPGTRGNVPAGREGVRRIFFPFNIGSRTTQWERGEDPMTSFGFTDQYDAYGQPQVQMSLAIPRSYKYRTGSGIAGTFLATASFAEFIYKDIAGGQYMVDRPLQSRAYDTHEDTGSRTAWAYRNTVLNDYSSYPLIGHSITYYDGDAFTGLGYGQIGNYGVSVKDERLVVTNDILTAAYGSAIPPCFSSGSTPTWSGYPTDFKDALQDLKLGYIYYAGTDGQHLEGYYTSPGGKQFDFQDGSSNPRGLLTATQDAFGDETDVAYDSYQLMPVTITDSVGMKTTADYNYRVMQPDSITDPNENIKLAAYSPLGLLYKTVVQGKTGEDKGDTLDHPTSLLEYDFFNFYYNQQPIWVKTSLRERHYYDDPTSPYIVKCDYSDGFGRLIQTRAQAEDVLFGDTPTGDSGLPADQSATNQDAIGHIRGSSDPLNVVVSGWQVYNNKGKVVEKFEPFFSSGFAPSHFGEGYGVRLQMFYDPRGQLIRTLNPDGTESKIVFGIPYVVTNPDIYAPTPWVSCAYDPNDLNADLLAYGTPQFHYIDALGRTIKTYEKNIFHNYITVSDEEQDITMKYEFDIRGNLLTVTDALGRTAFTHVYDLENKPLKTVHLDSGSSHALHDAMDRAVMADNANGAVTLSAYDPLSRIISLWARDDGATTTLYGLRHVVQYGDSSGLTNPQDQNLKGKVYRLFDEAGRVETSEYDFKGNPLISTRKIIDPTLFVNAVTQPGGPGTDWVVAPYLVDWGAATPPPLDSIDYTTQNSYDALNRITAMIYPNANSDSTPTTRTFVPTYNKAGVLESVDLIEDAGTPVTTNYVERITYNARGQRLMISLGNGLMTRYVYDSLNFRLLRMKTEGYVIYPSPPSGEMIYEYQSGTTKQDFAYSYDTLGNIINIVDATPDAGVGGIGTLSRDFDYDALYRLLQATGRENLTSPPYPSDNDPYKDNTRGTNAIDTTGYTQKYQYDEMGNIQELKHTTTSGVGNFNRDFNYDHIGDNNYLNSIDVWGNNYSFQYDPCGNQTLQNLDRNMAWDYADRMKSFYIWTGGTSEPTQYAQYGYDASGKRVLKVVRVAGGAYKVRIYIGSIFEEYYEYDSSSTFLGYQDEIMIMDNQSKIASKLMGTTYSEPYMGVKYIFPDHLGSSNVQCKPDGTLYSREEYYPFGETSFGSYGKKRYRFCGKERDEESGMYYYGARYYLSWTCRFVSVDPLAGKYPWSSYVYAGNNPIMLNDINGEGPDNSENSGNNINPLPDTYYTVGNGDTLWGIEKKLNLIHGTLTKLNPEIKNPNRIHSGDIIRLPDPYIEVNTTTNYNSSGIATSGTMGYSKVKIPPNANWKDYFGTSENTTSAKSAALFILLLTQETAVESSPIPPVSAVIEGIGITAAMIAYAADIFNETASTTPSAAEKEIQNDAAAYPLDEITGDRKNDPNIRWVTYTKFNPTTGQTYSGRASGPSNLTAEQIVSLRDKGHSDKIGYLAAIVDKDDVGLEGYAEIRGREQQLIDFYGRAQVEFDENGNLGTSGNPIRGVAKDNPFGKIYYAWSIYKFGFLYRYTGY